MSDFILVSGDKAIFNGWLGPASLMGNLTVPLIGSGLKLYQGKKVCVIGDEKSVRPVVSYTSREFTIPGEGELSITLRDNQISKVNCTGGKRVILSGLVFDATLTVTKPALREQKEEEEAESDPDAELGEERMEEAQPDPMMSYTGQGRFLLIGDRSDFRGE